MKYGFVTYERAQDAFTAIDTSHRDSQISMYDISFGGRRAFCRSSYADLGEFFFTFYIILCTILSNLSFIDNAGINNYNSYVFPKEAPAPKVVEDSFEALLLQVKAKLNAGKSPVGSSTLEAPSASGTVLEGHSQMWHFGRNRLNFVFLIFNFFENLKYVTSILPLSLHKCRPISEVSIYKPEKPDYNS